jgi:hypothetical protein
VIAATRKALVAAAERSLPGDAVRHVLVAAAGGPGAAEAWGLWCARHPDPLAALSAHKLRTVLPLLDVSLREHGVALAPAVRDGLRAAAVAERSRSERYDAVLMSLGPVLLPHRVLVLKGAALAHLVYPQRSLRHCHDIDLVTTREARSVIAQRLIASGFTPAHGALVHPSGLPVRMHTAVFATRRYHVEFDDVWDAGRALPIGDVAFRTLCEADALVHVCGHAATWRGPESARWWPDAAFLIRSSRVDWSRVERVVDLSGAAVPVLQRLAALSHHELVPEGPLARLEAIVGRAPVSTLAMEAAGSWQPRFGQLAPWTLHSRAPKDEVQ